MSNLVLGSFFHLNNSLLINCRDNANNKILSVFKIVLYLLGKGFIRRKFDIVFGVSIFGEQGQKAIRINVDELNANMSRGEGRAK